LILGISDDQRNATFGTGIAHHEQAGGEEGREGTKDAICHEISLGGGPADRFMRARIERSCER
jgi:hypothetical protein